MPTFKKNPSPFQMKGMSFQEGQVPMKKLSFKGFKAKLGKAWKKFKESGKMEQVSKGLSDAGDKLSNIRVEKTNIIDTRNTAASQESNAPDVTTIIASKDNPIKPIEKSSAMTKKSPYKNYKKGYYGA